MKKNETKFVYFISIVSLVIIGLTLIAYNLDKLINFKYFTNSEEYIFHTDKLGHFGDFIDGFLGTILTGIATYFVYKTYISQKEELEKQKEELILNRQLIAQQQFESTFFNMLNVHRELKNNLKLNIDETFYHNNSRFYADGYLFDENIKEIFGIDIFNIIREDYEKIYNSISSLDIFDEIISDKVKNYINNQRSEYSGYFKELEEDETNPKPNLAELLNGNWSENNNKLETHKKKILFTNELLYMNYQNVLSHYCRNVYHILKFIRKTEENDFTTKGDKTKHYKQYANILQSQLNVNEHFILFYNFILFFDNDEENKIFFPMNIVNHYHFLENIGIDNLILNNHKKQYGFPIKGD